MEMLKWASNSSALWFLGSHTVDLVRWLLDDEPRRVYAVSRSGILHKSVRLFWSGWQAGETKEKSANQRNSIRLRRRR